MILKEQLVLEKTKAESLSGVRNLNLWGEGLTDVSIVSKITGIEVLALAANHLTTLGPFASCTSLRELYLRKNNIVSLAEIRYIKDLPNLRTLWLMDNPCSKHPNYRNFVIMCCPHLKQLDNIEVTAKEREEAKKKLPERVIQDILERGTVDLEEDARRKPPSSARVSKGVEKPAAVNAPRRLAKEEKEAQPISNRESEGSRGTSSALAADSASFTTIQTQRAILTAIVSLLPELTLESLDMLQKEIREEVARKEKAVQQRAKGSQQL
ncbi:Protein C21orf2 [Trypanosoma grayi]|uniref:Protein C21orf2 n=1 Tax=Trypanosoma grayi TaxID=71804 RepID=UPI0004F46E83|nr:Protein C21orf2 [Trypanosoma grayi]KEG06578.1 Protein C21orf2 [Trypanosoma grayi]